MNRHLVITAAAAIGAFGVSAPALAGTASVTGTNISYTAPAGQTNLLTVSQTATAIVFVDTGAPVTAGAGCTALAANAASCAIPPSLNLVVATLNDLNDSATLDNSVVGPSDSGFQLLGGPGNDTLTGGENIDEALSGEDGNDTLNGRAGDDFLLGGPGNDTATGGAGDDRFAADPGDDVVDGGAGRDTLTLGPSADGADRINLGADSDRLDARQRTMPLTLTMDGIADDGATGEGDNVGADVEDVEGGRAADRIVASQTGSSTEIQGDGGNDSIIGGPGADFITGNDGNDTIVAGAGDDSIESDRGADSIDAGAGDDRVDTSFDDASSDTIRGGPGTDLVTYARAPAAVTVTLDDVANDGHSGENDNVASDVEDVVGTAYADTLVGNAAANQFEGGEGNDTLTGFAGSDGLSGGRGNDTINGGRDLDTLDGGFGADRIISRDASADDVICGGAVDIVLADGLDQLRACESVSRGAVIMTSRAPNLGGRVTVAVHCPAVEGAACSGSLRLSQRRRIGSRTFTIPAGATTRVTVRLARANRLTRGRTTATATFRDANLTLVTTTRRITIR